MNIYRILRLIKKELYENRKIIIIMFLSLFVVNTFISIRDAMSAVRDCLLHNINIVDQINYFEDTVYFYYFISFGFMIIFASLAMTNYKNKRYRINAIMLPASRIEKMVSKVVVYFVLPCLVAFIVAVVSDCIKSAIISAIYGSEYAVSIFYMFSRYFDPFDISEQRAMVWVPVMFGFMAISLSFLSSTIWRKYNLQKMCLSVAIMTAGFVYQAYLIDVEASSGRMFFRYLQRDISRDQALCIFILISSIVILISILLSYFRFKENEVIDYKK